MNINFKIDEIKLTEHSIKDFNLSANFEERSNLRNSKITNDVLIEGVINPEIAESGSREVEDTLQIANFAMISEKEDCYKDITYSFSNSVGRLIKEGDLKNSYVVYYEEEFSNDKGVGGFKATFREKSKGGTLA